MERQTYQQIEAYMLTCMQDSAHDKDHVYRVLYGAMTIAAIEQAQDMDVLIAACLLHDIARAEQMADPTICHALAGGEKAYTFLRGIGWTEEQAEHVRQCIRTHRFRKSDPPRSMEAKILYDADKLDVVGAIGIARTLAYSGAVSRPVYNTAPDGTMLDGSGEEPDCFCKEYRHKLVKVYDRFLTRTGERLARERRQAAEAFYQHLLNEVGSTIDAGRDVLNKALQ